MASVVIEDEVLPAAPYLTGPGSVDLLDATIAAAGGTLQTSRPIHVQYRPGSELVVRYDATVRWGGGEPVIETLLAATTVNGVLPGTVPLEADADGTPISVGVWRWPFDPILGGLTAAVTASEVADLLEVSPESLHLEVVAYRPTERAVVRATVEGTPFRYLKVLPPHASAAVAERHRRLCDGGAPVPPVVAHDAERGIVVMDVLTGPTLRELIKAGPGAWPPADEYVRVTGALAGVELPGAPPVRSRTADAIGHARMIGTVLADQRPRLDQLCEVFSTRLDAVAARSGVTIHGDLYEAQLVLDGARISGLLDVDDVGPGDPVDDLANVIAHLRYRADAHPGREHVERYADALASAFRGRVADLGIDPIELDLATAAALVGLATGPFRIQQHGWKHAVRRHLDRARRIVRSTGVGPSGLGDER